jgi:hypothetical protein
MKPTTAARVTPRVSSRIGGSIPLLVIQGGYPPINLDFFGHFFSGFENLIALT